MTKKFPWHHGEALLFLVSFLFMGKVLHFSIQIQWSPLFLTALILVALVQGLKAIRLYMLLLWQWKGDFFPIYGKMLFVTLSLPFKLGEVYRVYKINQQIQNVHASLSVILVDRFFDTIPLVFLFAMAGMGGIRTLSTVVWLIFVVFFVMLLSFFAFPPCFRFFNHYIIMTRPTRLKLSILKCLDVLQQFYLSVKSITKDRVAILSFLSMLIWSAEYLALLVIAHSIGEVFFFDTFLGYLESAFLGASHPLLTEYMFMTLLLLGLGTLGHLFWKGGKQNEKNSTGLR